MPPVEVRHGPGRQVRIDPITAGAAAVAALAAAVVGVVGVRGGDYPAHLLRAENWRDVGLSVWNFHWYRGHPTPSYSLVSPPLTALVGAFAVSAVASVVATVLFARTLLAYTRQAWAVAGIVVFALSTTVNVIVGRVPFGIGLALGMVAVDAWRRNRVVLAGGAALAVPLASPVAATFVALAAAAWVLDALLARRRGPLDRAAAIVLVAVTTPMVLLSIASQSEGRFPFRGDQVVFSLVLIGALAFLSRERVVRIAALLAAVVSIAAFVIPNPLGGNFLRFTQFVVLPVALAAFGVSARTHRRAIAALMAVGVGWSLQFGAVSAVAWHGDASVRPDYYAPLIAEVQRRNADGRPVGRLEIPFTENHWEAYFVAPEVPFARGWERQIDLERNAVLYDDALDAVTYRDWLDQNAVRWVAVPDTDLDQGGIPEARLIESGVLRDWLVERWRNADWVLYEVLGHQPIVDPPARLVEERADAIVVSTPEPATVVARYEAVDGVSISPGGCVYDADGTMRLELPEAGTYTISIDPSVVLPGDDELSCAGE